MLLRMFKNSQENICFGASFRYKRLQRRCFYVNFAIFFTNIFFYSAPPVAVSRLNLSNYSNSIPYSGRSLFINYINFIVPGGPKPNTKIITSITSSSSFVLKLPKAYSKDNLRKKKCPCKCLLKCEVKIWILSKFYIVFDDSSTILSFFCLTNLYACNSRFEITN